MTQMDDQGSSSASGFRAFLHTAPSVAATERPAYMIKLTADMLTDLSKLLASSRELGSRVPNGIIGSISLSTPLANTTKLEWLGQAFNVMTQKEDSTSSVLYREKSHSVDDVEAVETDTSAGGQPSEDALLRLLPRVTACSWTPVARVHGRLAVIAPKPSLLTEKATKTPQTTHSATKASRMGAKGSNIFIPARSQSKFGPLAVASDSAVLEAVDRRRAKSLVTIERGTFDKELGLDRNEHVHVVAPKVYNDSSSEESESDNDTEARTNQRSDQPDTTAAPLNVATTPATPLYSDALARLDAAVREEREAKEAKAAAERMRQERARRAAEKQRLRKEREEEVAAEAEWDALFEEAVGGDAVQDSAFTAEPAVTAAEEVMVPVDEVLASALPDAPVIAALRDRESQKVTEERVGPSVSRKRPVSFRIPNEQSERVLAAVLEAQQEKKRQALREKMVRQGGDEEGGVVAKREKKRYREAEMVDVGMPAGVPEWVWTEVNEEE